MKSSTMIVIWELPERVIVKSNSSRMISWIFLAPASPPTVIVPREKDAPQKPQSRQNYIAWNPSFHPHFIRCGVRIPCWLQAQEPWRRPLQCWPLHRGTLHIVHSLHARFPPAHQSKTIRKVLNLDGEKLGTALEIPLSWQYPPVSLRDWKQRPQQLRVELPAERPLPSWYLWLRLVVWRYFWANLRLPMSDFGPWVDPRSHSRLTRRVTAQAHHSSHFRLENLPFWKSYKLSLRVNSTFGI